MTTESTAPISVQHSALRLLADLATLHPELPAAYITVHSPWEGRPSEVDMKLDTPTEFEQWRIALGIDPVGVVLHPRGRGSWVQVGTTRSGVRITISSHGILLTQDQLTAPRGSEVAA